MSKLQKPVPVAANDSPSGSATITATPSAGSNADTKSNSPSIRIGRASNACFTVSPAIRRIRSTLFPPGSTTPNFVRSGRHTDTPT